MIQFKIATPAEQHDWDQFVTQHSESTPYHLFAWGLAVKTAYGHNTLYLMAMQNNTIVGVLPAIIFSKPFAKPSLCSLPFCDVAGVLANDLEIEQALITFATEQLNEHQALQLELRTSETNSLEPELFQQKVRMLLDLPQNSETLWTGFKSKLRSQIRKAEKNGLTADIAQTQNHLDGFYQVFSRNMRDLGSPVHSKKWFNALLKYYGDNLLIANVYHQDKVIGAGIVLFCGNKACIPWASTNSDFNRLAPNMLLYWTLLKAVTDLKIDIFDFGRSTFNEGTYKFKAQWGAKPQLLNWQVISSQSAQPDSTSNGSVSKIRPYIEQAWRKLPLGVTEWIGPKVRKYISL